MFLFAIPMWIKLIFFLIGNGPTIWKLIKEIRGLMSEMSDDEQKEVMEACKDDLKSYKKNRDKEALFAAIVRKRDQVKADRKNRREERRRNRRER